MATEFGHLTFWNGRRSKGRPRPDRRCSPSIRPEALEVRALLSGFFAEVSPLVEDVVLDVDPAAEEDAPASEMFQPLPTEEVVDRWFQFAFPWKIEGVTVEAYEIWNRPEVPLLADWQLPEIDSTGLRELPMSDALQVLGRIEQGSGMALYQLPVTPKTLQMRVELWPGAWPTPPFEWAESIGENPSARLLLFSPEGDVLGNWEIRAPAKGMMLDLQTLRPPSEPFLILGVDFGQPGQGSFRLPNANALPFTLAVLRQDRSSVSVGPESTPGFGSGPPLNLVADPTVRGPGFGRMPAGLLPFAGQGVGTSSLGSSALPIDLPSRFDVADGRPLPVQSAAPSTGSLPLGPPVRGEDVNRPVDLRLEQVLDRIEETALEQELAATTVESLVGLVPRSTRSNSSEQAPVPGLVANPLQGGLPLLGASLRSVLPGAAAPLEPIAIGREEDFAGKAMAKTEPALRSRTSPDSVFQPQAQEPNRSREASLVPMRPLTIRTALGVAAVLAVGLLLPDLGGVRSSLARPRSLLDRLRGRRGLPADPPSTA